jgi:hypothetical protein
MKKVNVFLVMVCLFGIWAASCVKENETVNTNRKKEKGNSTAMLIKKLKANVFEGSYLMVSKAGHTSNDCGGKCKYFNGIWVHVNCQGFGNECNFRASINISKNLPEDSTDNYYSGIGLYENEPIEDSTYEMPERSFYFESEEFENGFIWINIPEQVLIRNTESSMFIYDSITFTVDPLYENL